MPPNSNRANYYRALIADIGNAHIDLAILKTHGLELEEILVLRDLVARCERKVAAKLVPSK